MRCLRIMEVVWACVRALLRRWLGIDYHESRLTGLLNRIKILENWRDNPPPNSIVPKFYRHSRESHDRLAALENHVNSLMATRAGIPRSELPHPLPAKPPETDAGEPSTGNDTTPTCGPIGDESENHNAVMGKPIAASKEVMPHPTRPRHDKTAPSSVKAGEDCPTCGKRMGMTAAERQRRYRASAAAQRGQP